MSVYPMQYATEDVVLALRQRGKTFWKCRRRNYVCVLGTSDDHLSDAVSASSVEKGRKSSQMDSIPVRDS
jgi:hypothetical protein